MDKKMDKATIKIVTTWGIAALLFIVIFIVCIAFIFAPVKEVTEDSVITHPATSLLGGQLLGKSWKQYPEYTVGLGTAGVLSAAGCCYCIYVIYNKGNIRNEED